MCAEPSVRADSLWRWRSRSALQEGPIAHPFTVLRCGRHGRGLSQHSETRCPSDRDRIVTTGLSRFQPARPEVLR
jgi:hypothetical protein